jgi:hypothetical protein
VRAAAAIVLAACLGAAGQARAQLAVAASYSNDDVVQRDLVGLVMQQARSTWSLVPTPVAGCKGNDAACMRASAQRLGASHVLVVAIAPLGTRDHALAVQLFDVTNAKPLFDESAVQSGNDAQRAQVTQLAERLATVVGPPPRVASPPPAAAGPTTNVGTFVGAGLVGAGVVAAVVTAAAAVTLATDHQPVPAGTASLVGISVAGGLVVAGCGVLIVDSL